MRDRFPLLFIGAILLLGTVGSFVLRGAERGSFAEALSTYRSEPDGARALYLLAKESGLPVRRVQRSLEVLEDRLNLVLLAVELEEGSPSPSDDEGPFSSDAGVGDEEAKEELRRAWDRFGAEQVSEDERERLLEHVKRGATLVLATDERSNPVLEAVQVTPYRPEDVEELRTLLPAQPTPYTLGVDTVEAKVRAYFNLPNDATPLLVDGQHGDVAAALVPYGQGRVIVLGAPELASNAALPRADSAQLWLSLLSAVARSGPIGFDEFHHGFTSDHSMAEFAKRYGLHFAAAQLLFGLCLWAASLRRFGKPRPPPEDVRVGSTDALFAASRIYREGRHFAFSASLVARGLSQELAGHAGLPPRAEPSDVSAALASRGRQDLAAALSEVSSQARAVGSEAQLHELARKAASARSLVRPARRTRSTREALASRPPPPHSEPKRKNA